MVPKQGDSPVAVAWAWLQFHAALKTRGQPEVQSGVRAADPKTELIEGSTIGERGKLGCGEGEARADVF